MTETNSLGESNSQGQAASVAPDSAVPVSPQQTAAQEKSFRQSEVNAIAANENRRGYDKAMREIAERNGPPSQNASSQPAHVQSPQQNVQSPASYQPSLPQNISQEDTDKKMQEIAQRTFHQSNYDAALNNFYTQFNKKILDGRQKNPAFEQVERDLNLQQLNQTNREFVVAVGLMDNADEVLTDLRDNPHKLGPLLSLAANPATQNLALGQIKSLSDSIKQNQAAKAQKTPNAPLSQINHSVNGSDNGPLTVAELKRQDRYRV